MNYFELIKEYGAGKGEKAMLAATQMVSDYLEPLKDSDPEGYWGLIKKTYSAMCGKHYNKDFAEHEVEKMYYTDKEGNKHHAPYWTESEVKSVYEANKTRIKSPSYGFWDFYVVLQMMKSDYCPLLMKWFPEAKADELMPKYIDLAVNWLNDDDNPYGDAKAWRYFNG